MLIYAYNSEYINISVHSAHTYIHREENVVNIEQNGIEKNSEFAFG
jgi:hypothetical protein